MPLDHEHLAVFRIDRELDVAAACLDANLPNHRYCGVAHELVLAISQRHCGRDRYRIASVDTHRIDVLDRADDHDIVRPIAHHFELELLPPDYAALDQHLGDGREIEPATNDFLEIRRLDGRAHPLPPR